MRMTENVQCLWCKEQMTETLCLEKKNEGEYDEDL